MTRCNAVIGNDWEEPTSTSGTDGVYSRMHPASQYKQPVPQILHGIRKTAGIDPDDFRALREWVNAKMAREPDTRKMYGIIRPLPWQIG